MELSEVGHSESFKPFHLKKIGNSYEEKLVRILVEKKGLNFDYVIKQRMQYNKSLRKEYSGKEIVPTFPLTVNIELINKCNYACSMCYTVNHEGVGVPLEFEYIKKIIDECIAFPKF